MFERRTGFAILAFAFASMLSAAAQTFDDEFNSLVLNVGWSWVREDRAHWSLTGTDMQIITEPGALNGVTDNDVRNILLQQAPAGVFRMETKLAFAPDSMYHNAGLIYYIDDDNYMRASRGIYDTLNGVWFEIEIGGLTNFYWLDGVTDNPIYLRLSRNSGNLFRATWSPDGVYWHTIGEEVVQLTGTPRIGIQAANGKGILATTERIPARFDYFRIAQTGADDRLSPESSRLDVYPNPAAAGATVTIRSGDDDPVRAVRITDALGRIVFRSGAAAGGIRVDTRLLVPGAYGVIIETSGGLHARQLLVTR